MGVSDGADEIGTSDEEVEGESIVLGEQSGSGYPKEIGELGAEIEVAGVVCVSTVVEDTEYMGTVDEIERGTVELETKIGALDEDEEKQTEVLEGEIGTVVVKEVGKNDGL